MSKEKNEYLSVRICENLPLDLTILAKNGFCQKPNADCKYNRLNLDPDLNFCYKKATTIENIRSTA